jgi:FeS assembly SUF system protein
MSNLNMSNLNMRDDQQIDNKPSKVSLDKDDLVKALKTVYDPEIPVDIYELGLIYDVSLKESGNVDVKMTLTAPGCPVAGEMPQWVENALMSLEGVNKVVVEMVFDPPWDMSLMSEEARLTLNMY